MASAIAQQCPQRILFIGKTGSGKSRLINLLSKVNQAKTSHSIKSGTKDCHMYYFTDNNIQYTLVDTVGLADTDKSDEEVVQDIKNFLKQSIPDVNWVVVTLNGAEKLTKENTAVLQNILAFLELDKCIDNVLFCVTHADMWSGTRKQQYMKGAPDPDDLEDENQEYAQKQVEQAREKFCNALPRQDTSILRDKIAKWKELDAQNALLRQIAAERKKQGHCTIL
jgi:predicted GTPase